MFYLDLFGNSGNSLGLLDVLLGPVRPLDAGLAFDSNWRESQQGMLKLVEGRGCTSVSAFLEEHLCPDRST